MNICGCDTFRPGEGFSKNLCRNPGCNGIRPSMAKQKVRKPLKRSKSPGNGVKMASKAPKVSFASICLRYGIVGPKGPSQLRWKTPMEKGLCWELVKKIVRKREKDCYTCRRQDLERENADTGHCYPVAQVGSNNTLSWDLRLIHLQCSYCNGPGQGEQGLYEERIKRDYGEEFLLEARQRRYKSDPVKDWKAKLERLEELLGVDK